MTKPVILISGASRGLGAATAAMAARLGADVALFARSEEQLEQVAQSIRTAGSQVLVFAGDVSQPDDCQQVVRRSMNRFERIDALINNAGMLEPVTKIADADLAVWQRNLMVNLFGPLQLTQAALPYLRQAHGRVIHVSSGAAITPMFGWSAYCVAKAALNHLSRVLSMEEPLITSLCVRPGVVDTAMQATLRQKGSQVMPSESYQRFVQLHEQGKLLAPEKPGRALALLALYAPLEWSGEFINWDDERIKALALGKKTD